jgi:hypothetical protein
VATALLQILLHRHQQVQLSHFFGLRLTEETLTGHQQEKVTTAQLISTLQLLELKTTRSHRQRYKMMKYNKLKQEKAKGG